MKKWGAGDRVQGKNSQRMKKEGAAVKMNCEGRKLLGEMSGVSQNLHKLY
jgi:hypothetical protein